MKRIVLLMASLWLVTSSLHAKIVFHSNRVGNHEIYTMNLDGTNQTRLTFNEVGDFSLSPKSVPSDAHSLDSLLKFVQKS